MDLDNRKYLPFDFKASVKDEGKGIIHAVVSVFGNEDSYGDVMVKGAFKKSIERGKQKGKLPPGVWSHDWERPIAKTLDAFETDEGLNVIGQFNLETKDGSDAYSNVKNGLFTEYSFGFKRIEGGEEEKDGKNYVKDVDWFEWSPVLVGANRETYTVAVKSFAAYADAQQQREEKWNEILEEIRSLKSPLWGNPQSNFIIDQPGYRGYFRYSRPLATSEREFEEFLREAGYSRSLSVAITNHGFKTLLRDAASDDAGTPDSTDDGATEEAPVPDETPETEQPENQPNPTDEPDTPASETPASDDGKSGEGQAIVSRGAFVDPLTAFGPELLAKQREVDALLYLEWEDMTARFNRRGLSAQ